MQSLSNCIKFLLPVFLFIPLLFLSIVLPSCYLMCSFLQYLTLNLLLFLHYYLHWFQLLSHYYCPFLIALCSTFCSLYLAFSNSLGSHLLITLHPSILFTRSVSIILMKCLHYCLLLQYYYPLSMLLVSFLLITQTVLLSDLNQKFCMPFACIQNILMHTALMQMIT